jgi:hypothetical protein
MAVRTIRETAPRFAQGREKNPDGWGPGRVWLAWGIYFTVLAIVALAALAGT